MAASAKKRIKELKTLRVADLEDKSVREVWAMNNTKPKGEIALGVKSPADGSVTLVIIPATWIPVCLTEQVPKQMLLNSPDFRKLVSSGGITVVESKGVLELLNDEDIRREAHAILNRNKSDAIDAPTELPKENHSMLVLDIVAREINNEITEQGSLDILYTQEDSLTNDDLEYLVKNSSFQKVKTWAAETLTARGEDDEA